jgi:transposase
MKQVEMTYVGMDVHKASISIALLLPGTTKPLEWQVGNDPDSNRLLARQLKRKSQGPILVCYEAGSCGFVLQRLLKEQGIHCQVIAPSLIPYRPGERIKTDRRDARKLAECLRAGLLREVVPPDEAEEAVRDLVRCREDAQQDRIRCRHRLTKMLLRRGFSYSGRAFSLGWRAWLKSLKLPLIDQQVLDDYLLAYDQVESRLKALTSQIEEVATKSPYQEKVKALRCFRGIDTLSAMILLAEIRQFSRFESPRQFMAYLGLVPSESSSGGKVHRGPLTKTGNGHVRRILVECAHQYHHRPAVGPTLRRRRQGQKAAVVAIADKAQVRLHRRFQHLALQRRLPYNKVITALARELCGFLWSVLYPLEVKAAA